MNKTEIREKIWKYEYYRNGFSKLCGTGVRVLNLRINKNKATADIILITDDENEFGSHYERYNDCEYNLDKMGEKI